VIAPDFDVPGLLGVAVMKCGQPLVNGGVSNIDLIEAFDFPKLLRIAQFDQRESFRQVIVEGAFEDQRIGGKVIGPGPVAPMGIGKDNKPGIGRGDKVYGFDITLNNLHFFP
jgi:hypothetical protein